ncbi:MAG: UDP-N-acetylmuramoyl-tripeptide--D-alanyl-D-alanine ligase [Muribaculaceae bacterium]|nr:UDP-N-acetylmuramoyl-tripeptide--D-alanyl-D-alanine ligase [Muribaculaceae bacterium]
MDIQKLYDFYTQHPVVTTDSRDCPEGSIFIALRGDSFDGNQFATQALEKGCALAVVDDAGVFAHFEQHPLAGKQMMLVPDALQAFKDLAREHRRQFHIPVVGITGTNGKTTTKELVRAVLAQKFNVMATEGNFNNDVGVPKTLLRMTAEHEIAVVEMGASHPGDIRTLARTAEPTCGLITNVGKAHLQGFGSLQGVISTKGELYDFLATQPAATIFVNADNALLTGILPAGVATVPYSQQAGTGEARVAGELMACDPMLRLRWRDNAGDGCWHQVATHLIGSYNLDNVLAAVTVGLHFGVDAAAIDAAIEGYVPSNNRSQLTHTAHNHLIVDAYNANPTSMAAALANFDVMQVSPKMAILGEMRELGDSSREEHEKMVSALRRYGFDKVWLVGDEFAAIDCPFRKFHDVAEVKAAIAECGPQGYYILIKGSNGNRLFQLPELL